MNASAFAFASANSLCRMSSWRAALNVSSVAIIRIDFRSTDDVER
jgi:hypothetical protein